jgi:hypothetical protein
MPSWQRVMIMLAFLSVSFALTFIREYPVLLRLP